MDNSLKIQRVPVSSNGLHHHQPNVPLLATSNFFEPFCVWKQPLKKGEKFDRKAGSFGRTLPTVNAAMVTGRYYIRAFFCPYIYFFRPWYEFDQGIEYHRSDGLNVSYSKSPYCTMGDLSKALMQNLSYMGISSTNTDVLGKIGSNDNFYQFTKRGARLFRLLQSLGITPTWYDTDATEVNLLAVLAWLKIYAEYIYPAQYRGNSMYDTILRPIKDEKYHYDSNDVVSLLAALDATTLYFYDSSMFDAAFDTPAGPNDYGDIVQYDIKEQSPTYANTESTKTNVFSDGSVDDSDNSPLHSPFIGNTDNNLGDSSFVGRITKFTLDALEDLSKFLKRKQLAGGRLVDQFLVDRGQKLSHYVSRSPYFLGETTIEIEVDAVENNSDTNLGELAGRGQMKSERPIHFKGEADEDGMLIIMAVAVPDADIPCYNDPFNFYVEQLDFHHSQFDKLGVEPIKTLSVYTSMNYIKNQMLSPHFGYWPMYTGHAFYSPRLLGDFNLYSRGAVGLRGYHSFRLIDDDMITSDYGLFHSMDFVRTNDANQYNRLFYSDKVDNLILYLRWYGDDYLEKLQPADSYDWDDDEFKKKVDVLYQGMKIR